MKLKLISGPHWETILRRRLRGNAPVSETHPELVQQEYDGRNYYPATLLGPGSGERVWWICRHGHKCRNRISTRTRAVDNDSKFRGCPDCAARSPQLQQSLSFKFPLLALEYMRKANACPPSWVSASSSRLVSWRCISNRKHVFRSKVCARTTHGQGCPFCFSKQRIDLAKFPQALAQYDLTAKNRGFNHRCLPETYKVFWNCSRNSSHSWYGSFAALRKRDWRCPRCLKQRLSELSKLLKEIHATKNGTLNPRKIRAGSHDHIIWQCQAGSDHVWSAAVYSRAINSDGCPFCANRRVSETNSLLNFPKIAGELDRSRNGTATPETVNANSTKKLWWICSACRHQWQREVRLRTHRGSRCPKCKGGVRERIDQDATAGTGPALRQQKHFTVELLASGSNPMPYDHNQGLRGLPPCGVGARAQFQNVSPTTSDAPDITESLLARGT